MRKGSLLAVGMVMVLSLVAGVACDQGQGAVTEEQSAAIALEFLETSPTFAYDGVAGSIEMVDAEALRCPQCWAFEFDFECLHAGYGDRTGQVLAQVITAHTAHIVVVEGNVTAATIDGVWDMLEQEMIEEGTVEGTTEEMTVTLGDTFTIELDSNPTTGYAWQAQFDQEYLELVDTEFEPSSGLLGAGGVERFTFRALSEGDTELTMLYKRSWEQVSIDQVVYTIHIEGAQ